MGQWDHREDTRAPSTTMLRKPATQHAGAGACVAVQRASGCSCPSHGAGGGPWTPQQRSGDTAVAETSPALHSSGALYAKNHWLPPSSAFPLSDLIGNQCNLFFCCIFLTKSDGIEWCVYMYTALLKFLMAKQKRTVYGNIQHTVINWSMRSLVLTQILQITKIWQISNNLSKLFLVSMSLLDKWLLVF